MHYIIIPRTTCEERRVFLKNKRTPDGEGVVVTMRELGLIQFSPGQVTILNTNDLVTLMEQGKAETETTDAGADIETAEAEAGQPEAEADGEQ